MTLRPGLEILTKEPDRLAVGATSPNRYELNGHMTNTPGQQSSGIQNSKDGVAEPDSYREAMPTSSDLGDRSLIDVLSPTPTDDPTLFVGDPNPYGSMGIYGGHFLGQALAAGLATVDEAKLAHSFHAYFLNRGDPAVPIEYRVSMLRQSKGSEARSVAAWQNDTQVFQMMASFKRTEGGLEHQPQAPKVVSAEELVSARVARGEDKFPFPPVQNGWTEMEWASPTFLELTPGREAQLRVWMRVPEADALTSRDRQVVLAFLSDGPLMFNSVIPYGVAMKTIWATTLDHSVWFHRATNPAEWMLFDQRSTAAADGRGLNSGEIYDAAGQLIMSCTQESILRPIRDT